MPSSSRIALLAQTQLVECTFTGTTGVNVQAQAEMVRQAVREGVDGIALNHAAESYPEQPAAPARQP